MRVRFLVIVCLALLAGCAAPQSNLKSGLSLENMDRDIRPQDDLYGFANGTWMAKTEIPSDKSNYGSFTALADKAREDVLAIIKETAAKQGAPGSNEQKVGDLYASVMNVDKLEELGNRPLHPLTENVGTKKEVAAMFGWYRTLGIWGPVGLYVSYDAKNPRRYLSHVTQSGLGLPDRDYYFKEGEREENIRQKYRVHLAKMMQLAGFAPDEETATAQASAIYDLEVSLAKGHWTRVERRDRDKRYNPATRETLEARQGGFDWKEFFVQAKVADQTDFIVGEPSYFDHFEKVFSETPVETWRHYLKWIVVNDLASSMHKVLDEQNFDFYGRTLAGTPEQKPRWERAVGAVNGMLGEAVGQLYVARHFKPEAKERMVAMVEQLRGAYADALAELEWLGDETRSKALEKLKKFRPKIGYPDVWKDYSTLTVKADDLVGNQLGYAAWGWAKDVKRLGGPVDRDEWFMNPQTVNAYYNPPMNEIVFPAAILQPPFFNLEADEAVNYGGIGAVIGHEMGHGFDDQGAKSDGDGVLQNWWTEEDMSKFKSRTSKLVDQAAAYTVLDEQHLNGEFTLGENIGDLGGLTIAVRAWRRSLEGQESPSIDGFTGLQRFFLGWAQVWARKYRDEELRRRLVLDPHAPSEFRANGPIRNVPEFIEAFGVKEGDKLFLPESERVKIW
jgi:putative endopeptidase